MQALHEGSLLESEVNELQKKLAADVPVAWAEKEKEKGGSKASKKLTPSEHLQKVSPGELEEYQKTALKLYDVRAILLRSTCRTYTAQML